MAVQQGPQRTKGRDVPLRYVENLKRRDNTARRDVQYPVGLLPSQEQICR